MRILYLLSDFIYFIIYHVAGYRKKVVFQNLSIAFPEKTEKEKIEIAKNQNYDSGSAPKKREFCDLIHVQESVFKIFQ